jgi:hypothetical protein
MNNELEIYGKKHLRPKLKSVSMEVGWLLYEDKVDMA